MPGAQFSVGLMAMPLPGGGLLWGKSGARYGYATFIAASRDGSRRIAYSVTANDAKAEGQIAVTQRVIAAAAPLLLR